jgi:hypothetical protein
MVRKGKVPEFELRSQIDNFGTALLTFLGAAYI